VVTVSQPARGDTPPSTAYVFLADVQRLTCDKEWRAPLSETRSVILYFPLREVRRMRPPALRVRQARLDDAEPMARVVVSANSIFRELVPEASLVSYEESAANWRRCLREKPASEYLYVAEEETGEVEVSPKGV